MSKYEAIETDKDLTYPNQRFYSPRLVLDKSLYKEGQLIPVMEFIDKDLYNQGEEIAKHNSIANATENLQSIPSSGYDKVPIDLWMAPPENKVFTHIRGAIIAPIHKIFGLTDDDPSNILIDYFYVTPKRCYNSDTKIKDGKFIIGFRDHCTNYLNYFVTFYDKELQLLNFYAQIKYMIDVQTEHYNLNNFKSDLWKYFINPNASYQAQYLNFQIDKMNMEQYNLELNYKNNKSPVLEYTDFHAKLMLKISIMQNMLIPLITHFIVKKNIVAAKVKDILLDIFDLLFQAVKMIYNIDLTAKICETTFSNVTKNTNSNPILWDMQNIRARNSTTHSIETVENIIMQIIPKYTYNKNIIHFNYNAINRDIKFRVTDVPYEYSFVVLSSSIRDDDNNSECDKFEAHTSKLNEAIMIQTLVNTKTTMERIEQKYGPFDEREIKFYYNQMCVNGQFVANSLQRTLVFYLFNKEFGDAQSTRLVNIRQYIILIIAARRILASYKMFQLPYMIGGKVNRVVSKKNINKRELDKIKQSKYYPMIHAKYNNEKIEQDVILSLIAQILSSEFQTIDYYNPSMHELFIHVIPDVVSEEICKFIMLI